MAKYYVQSGTLRTMITAQTTGKAAIWAVHQAMQQVFPIDGMTPCDHDQPAAVLASVVCVSELGFDRDDAVQLSTMNVVTQWNEMVNTLDRLERMVNQIA